MEKYFSEYINKPEPIYHQWLSAYVAEHDFLIDDQEILQAIMNHTTASPDMKPLDMCVYCADKLDPVRGYDSSKQIALCNQDIVTGFCQELNNFYAIADCVILCGSFAPIGGHNPLEPAFFHAPILSGKHIYNQNALFSLIEGYELIESQELKEKLQNYKTLPHSYIKESESKFDKLIALIQK